MLVFLAIPNNKPARLSRQFRPIGIILVTAQKRTPPASDGAKFRGENNGGMFYSEVWVIFISASVLTALE